ncbi:MAG: LysM peptidoglycan-binding domain-containing protein [Saprospiraceae bacterium]|nr:MAG: peptidoglycan-binding lysin domain-containing protein [Bacteroidetes bacterium OLB9]MCO6463670.1 LysM peptidoglycan-binding domain-containing protein [Saprospiraceae bacterium]MCZ2336767.1 LysM peptidoglycan-binding domain-containing protein [Chitinophagales bacterium]
MFKPHATANIVIQRCKSTVFLLLLVQLIAVGQIDYNRFFSSGSEIAVDHGPENVIYYSHVYDKHVTIYSLAQFFQVTTDEIFQYNNISPSKPIHAGKIVNVPLQKRKITAARPSSGKYYVMKYSVKKGESMYSISQQFNTTVAVLQLLNSRNSFEIQKGELITVGFYCMNNTQKTTIRNGDLPSPLSMDITHSESKPDTSITRFYISDVIGFYDKKAPGVRGHYVLYNEARPGTIMDIYNPMLRKSIKAKVLGRIPENTYKSDVEIIITANTAKELGILDSRFKVNVKYEK